MTEKTHWFKLYSSDFLAGVAMLSAAERGVYITILAAIYDNQGPIEDNRRRLARLCCTSNSSLARALEALVETGKLQISDGYITNNRAEIEIRKQDLLSEKRKLGGEKSQQKQRQASETQEQKSRYIRSQKLDNKKDTKVSQKGTDPRGSRLPADWQPPASWIDYAIEKGMTNEQAHREAENFGDYWIAKAGAQARKADWQRTWQTWIRRALEHSGRPAARSPGHSPRNASERQSANTSRRRDALRSVAEAATGGAGGSAPGSGYPGADGNSPGDHRRLPAGRTR